MERTSSTNSLQINRSGSHHHSGQLETSLQFRQKDCRKIGQFRWAVSGETDGRVCTLNYNCSTAICHERFFSETQPRVSSKKFLVDIFQCSQQVCIGAEFSKYIYVHSWICWQLEDVIDYIFNFQKGGKLMHFCGQLY